MSRETKLRASVSSRVAMRRNCLSRLKKRSANCGRCIQVDHRLCVQCDCCVAGLPPQRPLGAQPAPASVQVLAGASFGAPAACWSARTTVLSMSRASKSASWRIAAMPRCHTPFLPQREKRVYVACQFPHAGSKSRHGLPVRAIHSAGSRNRRLSFAITPQSVALPGSSSLIRSHWSSRSSVRGIGAGFLLRKNQNVPTSIDCVQALAGCGKTILARELRGAVREAHHENTPAG